MDDRLAKRRYRIGARMFTAAVAWLRYWLLGGLALSLALTAVLAAAGVDLDTGAWRVAVSIGQWFWAVSAGVWLYTLVPVQISRGVTRREITVAFAVFGALTTAAAVAFATVGFLAEHALLELMGEPLDSWGGALASGARYLLLTPIYFLGGTAISAAAMRVGRHRLLIPAILLLAGGLYVAALFLEYYDLSGRTGAAAAWLGAGLALIAALAALCAGALRSLPLRPRGA